MRQEIQVSRRTLQHVARRNAAEIRSHSPSEDIEAPESLNSSVPICIGNTRSCGRICGILATVLSVSGSTAAMPLVSEELTEARAAGVAMVGRDSFGVYVRDVDSLLWRLITGREGRTWF